MIEGQHDPRPRVHIWPTRQGYAWSFGPRGNRIDRATMGECTDQALLNVGDKPFIIIVEPRGN